MKPIISLLVLSCACLGTSGCWVTRALWEAPKPRTEHQVHTERRPVMLHFHSKDLLRIAEAPRETPADLVPLPEGAQALTAAPSADLVFRIQGRTHFDPAAASQPTVEEVRQESQILRKRRAPETASPQTTWKLRDGRASWSLFPIDPVDLAETAPLASLPAEQTTTVKTTLHHQASHGVGGTLVRLGATPLTVAADTFLVTGGAVMLVVALPFVLGAI